MSHKETSKYTKGKQQKFWYLQPPESRYNTAQRAVTCAQLPKQIFKKKTPRNKQPLNETPCQEKNCQTSAIDTSK